MITTTLSIKNQITLPKFLLDLFKIKSGDKLLVEAESEKIIISPVGESIIDSLANSLKIEEAKKGVPFEKVKEVTQKIVAKKLANK